MGRVPLRVVASEPTDRQSNTDPETMLAALVPELIAAEKQVARLAGHVAAWRQLLATQRGVAFIREEQVRAEFGR